ncbi:MAG: DUF2764 family protein [Bacteroidaceae bacterium]|nr:DUF2764 family protein [Bacteroidaceae bacterium]
MAGLPDLRLDSPESAPSIRDLRELIEEQDDMNGRDLRMTKLFFLVGDCRNLIILLGSNLAELPYTGNWNKQELQEMIADALEDEFEDDPRFPPFMADFVREYFEKKQEPGYFPEDRLMVCYWQYLKQEGTGLLKNWATLSLDIANTLTALICERQGWQTEQYTYGYDKSMIDDALLAQLREIASDADPVRKEQRLDALKWLWLEDETFFDPFDVNALYAYLLKTEILERWIKLNPETGKEKFQQIIEDLRHEATVPPEFTTYMPKTEGIYDKNANAYNKNEK